jgi:hypothetical protein
LVEHVGYEGKCVLGLIIGEKSEEKDTRIPAVAANGVEFLLGTLIKRLFHLRKILKMNKD